MYKELDLTCTAIDLLINIFFIYVAVAVVVVVLS